MTQHGHSIASTTGLERANDEATEQNEEDQGQTPPRSAHGGEHGPW